MPCVAGCWRTMGWMMVGVASRGWRPGGCASGGRAKGTRYRAACLAVAVIASAAVAGCGGGTGGGAPQYELQARTIPGLGKVVADGQGFTLYMYGPDHRGASRCTGVCASQWPPVVLPRGVTRPRAGPGIRAALLGTVRRGDGALQVTYNRWPLYLWPGDAVPGQATGQGDDMGLWYTLSVTGAVDEGTPR
jgi:predicted lipoprotein with Yx(FWY)xxD motif